ncbi:MAG: hypothetical protein JO247_04775, partial [Chloroflexi bacterium]|nr:hypothetical protein [Chloroflexota bacterium]
MPASSSASRRERPSERDKPSPKNSQLAARQRAEREEPEPFAAPLTLEIAGVGVIVAAALVLLSIFPADSLLAHNLGPAILRGLGGPGGVLLAVSLGAVGLGLFVQGVSEQQRVTWQRLVGAALLLWAVCGFSQLIAHQGGWLGSSAFGALRYAFGQAGAVLVLIGVLAIGVILAFEPSLATLYTSVLFLAGQARARAEVAAADFKERRANGPDKPVIEINTGDDDDQPKIIKFPKPR